jgi:hypothetical protein
LKHIHWWQPLNIAAKCFVALQPTTTNLIVAIFVLATKFGFHKAMSFVVKLDLATKCWLHWAKLSVPKFVLATMYWWQYNFLFIAIEKFVATLHRMVA